MAMQLKKAVGEKFILDRERHLLAKAKQKLSKVENLLLLGNALADEDSHRHLPVLSFVVRASQFGRFLHHNFVCALLNDLFGIQARGGNFKAKSCWGPFRRLSVGTTSLF